MRLLKTFGAFALSALAFIGCNNEISYEVVPAEGKTIITATLEGGNTKTYIGEDGYAINWQKNDKISVFYNEGSNGGYTFKNIAEDGPTAKFEGSLPVIMGDTEDAGTKGNAPLFWGVFPQEKLNAVSAEGVAIVPFSHTQYAKPGNFYDLACTSIGCSENLNLKFYNVYGILAITVDVEGISVIELKSNETDYSYAHYYQVEFAAENGSALRPHIIGAVDQTILDNESVFSTTSVLLQALTETNDFATFVPGTTYYMVVPPHVYSQGATFNAYGDDRSNPIYTKSTKEGVVLTVERNKIHPVNIKFNQQPEEPEGTITKYVKVKSTDDIVDGKYLFVYESESVAFNGALETLDAVENTIPVTITEGVIAASDAVDAAAFEISVSEGSILSASGKYIGASSNSNGLKTSDTNVFKNTFAINNDGEAVIAAVFEGSTMSLRYNKASNQLRFRYYKSGQEAIALYRGVAGSSTPDPEPEVVADPVFEPAGGEVDFNTEVYLSCATEGAAIYYGYNPGEVPANLYEGKPFIITEDVTIYAIATKDGLQDSEVAYASFTVKTVVPPTPSENGSGTLEDPFNIAGAKAYIDEGGTDWVFVKGIISSITESFGSKYGNATFNISDDGSADAPEFLAYRILYLENAKWEEGNSQIDVNDEVILYGQLQNYGGTYETKPNAAYVYSLNGKTAEEHDPVIEAADINNIPADGVDNATTDVTIKYAEDWIVSVQFDGTIVTDASYKNGKLTYSVAANEGEARESTITIVLTKDEANVISKDIKVSQLAAGVVVNNGSGTLEDPFNVAGVKDYIDGNGAEAVYVAGIVSSVTEEYGSQYGNATFTISDDGSAEAEQFTAYRILFLENKKWEEGNSQLKAGDEVIILGKVLNYKGTYETSSGNAYLYSLNGATSEILPPLIVASNITNIPAAGMDGAWRITIKRAEDWTVTATPDGEIVTAASVDAPNGELYSINYTVAANTGDAREGSITVTVAKEGEESITKIIKVSQLAANSGSGEGTKAWVKTALADITEGQVFVIVSNNGANYAMSNDKGTSSAPTVVAVTVENDMITSDVADNIKWTLTVSDGKYSFYPNGDTDKWLYCTESNNGVRVGTNDTNQKFSINTDYLYNEATKRYLGVYSSQDWRCYTSINSNIKNQTLSFYVYR